MPTKVKGPLLDDYMRALKAAKRFGAKSVRIDIGDVAMTIQLDDAAEEKLVAAVSPKPRPRPIGRW